MARHDSSSSDQLPVILSASDHPLHKRPRQQPAQLDSHVEFGSFHGICEIRGDHSGLVSSSFVRTLGSNDPSHQQPTFTSEIALINQEARHLNRNSSLERLAVTGGFGNMFPVLQSSQKQVSASSANNSHVDDSSILANPQLQSLEVGVSGPGFNIGRRLTHPILPPASDSLQPSDHLLYSECQKIRNRSSSDPEMHRSSSLQPYTPRSNNFQNWFNPVNHLEYPFFNQAGLHMFPNSNISSGLGVIQQAPSAYNPVYCGTDTTSYLQYPAVSNEIHHRPGPQFQHTHGISRTFSLPLENPFGRMYSSQSIRNNSSSALFSDSSTFTASPIEGFAALDQQTQQSSSGPSSAPIELSNLFSTFFSGKRNRRETIKSCSHCNFTGSSEKELRQHMLRHGGTLDKPFVCSLCRAAFKRQQDWERHSISHGQASIQCKLCGGKFKRKDGLIRHMRNIHPTVNDELKQEDEKEKYHY